MTRVFSVLSILFIVTLVPLTPESLANHREDAIASDDPTRSPAGLEIERLRGEVQGVSLERLNASLFFLVREYDQDTLYSVLKDATPGWVISRGEVEQHLKRLRLSLTAVQIYYKNDRAAIKDALRGMSETEIIKYAESLE